jgi:hypothetical protein
VVLSPMPSTANEDETLTVCSISYDLDLLVVMVISSVGLLEPEILTPIATLNICSF